MYFSMKFLKYSNIKATWYSSCMSCRLQSVNDMLLQFYATVLVQSEISGC